MIRPFILTFNCTTLLKQLNTNILYHGRGDLDFFTVFINHITIVFNGTMLFVRLSIWLYIAVVDLWRFRDFGVGFV